MDKKQSLQGLLSCLKKEKVYTDNSRRVPRSMYRGKCDPRSLYMTGRGLGAGWAAREGKDAQGRCQGQGGQGQVQEEAEPDGRGNTRQRGLPAPWASLPGFLQLV